MAGMNDQRRDQGGLIVLGCLLVGLLSVCLLGGSALTLVRMRMVPVGIEMQQATRAEEEAREAQASARSEEEKAASLQDPAQPETPKSTNN